MPDLILEQWETGSLRDEMKQPRHPEAAMERHRSTRQHRCHLAKTCSFSFSTFFLCRNMGLHKIFDPVTYDGGRRAWQLLLFQTDAASFLGFFLCSMSKLEANRKYMIYMNMNIWIYMKCASGYNLTWRKTQLPSVNTNRKPKIDLQTAALIKIISVTLVSDGRLKEQSRNASGAKRPWGGPCQSSWWANLLCFFWGGGGHSPVTLKA